MGKVFMFVRNLKRTILIILFGAKAMAANWYVRDGASGGGTSWSDAYDQLSSAETSAARGDTIFVAAGTYAAVTFNTATSGTTKIFIKRATVADHGTSTGWSDAYDGIVTITPPYQFTSSYWDFNGVTWAGIVTSGQSGAGLDGGGIFNITGDEVAIRYVKWNCDYSGGAEHTVVAYGSNPVFDHCYWYKSPTQDHLVLRIIGTCMISNCLAQMINPPADAGHRDFCNTDGTGGFNISMINSIFEDHQGLGWILLLQNNTAIGHILAENCVFSRLEAHAFRMGSGNAGYASLTIRNCIFNDTVDGNGFSSGNITNVNNVFMGSGYSGDSVHTAGTATYGFFSGAQSGYSAGTGNLNGGTIAFVNTNSAVGVDGIPFTADDGWQTTTGSALINAGTTTTTPTSDIRGWNYIGTRDIGPYEFGSSAGGGLGNVLNVGTLIIRGQ